MCSTVRSLSPVYFHRVTGTRAMRASTSSPSSGTKSCLRLRSEITFQLEPPALRLTPVVLVALVKSLYPPAARVLNWLVALASSESVVDASDQTKEPVYPFVLAR